MVVIDLLKRRKTVSINLLYGKPVADSIYKDIHYPNKKVLHIFQVGDLEESNR